MINPYAHTSETLQSAQAHFAKVARLLQKTTINLDEYTSSIFDRLRVMPLDFWSPCLDLVPAPLLRAFFDRLCSELEHCDFMPYPGGFLLDNRSDDYIQKLQLELRPVYVALYDLTRNKLNQVGKSL